MNNNDKINAALRMSAELTNLIGTYVEEDKALFDDVTNELLNHADLKEHLEVLGKGEEHAPYNYRKSLRAVIKKVLFMTPVSVVMQQEGAELEETGTKVFPVQEVRVGHIDDGGRPRIRQHTQEN
ncbi:hypothetical protein GR11A_00104 [Vibrio phage vB_VcorM_GR11A]|nr:hypothetical protein GR11A_00104 [Vibrio phage vB_VcorM_GR11A]